MKAIYFYVQNISLGKRLLLSTLPAQEHSKHCEPDSEHMIELFMTNSPTFQNDI